jgi:predicted nucleic acid-binding protein
MHEEINEWSGDVLRRKKYADFLTQYLVAKEGPFVININAPWGSGKTFFIEHWCEDLKKEHPCVLFNAWENDFSNDPLLSVISHIKESLQSYLSVSDKEDEAIKSGLFSIGRLIKSVIPILAKAAASKAIGELGYKEISDLITEKDEESVTAIVGRVTEELVENNKAAKDAIKNFQISLADLIEKLTCDQGHLKKPLFIFIDELDRCRPLYAIELLERIKHLFGVPGIVFVIATDTEQLKHSINAIYGSGFDSTTYLRRFFDQSYTLSLPDYIEHAKLLFQEFDPDLVNKFVQIGISLSGDEKRNWVNIGGDLNEYRGSDEYTLTIEKNELAEMVLLFSLFSAFFRLDLRTQKQCYEKILAIISSVPFGEKLHFAYLIFLIMLEAKVPVLFKEYFSFGKDQDREKKELIKNKFSSFYNIRISERLYYALDFVDFYSMYAYADHDGISNAIKRRRHPSAEVRLLESIRNNQNNMKQYEEWVLLACDLD